MNTKTSSRTTHDPRTKTTAAGTANWRDRLLSFPTLITALIVVGLVAILYVFWLTSPQQNSGAEAGGAGEFNFAVGDPGPGKAAPDFTLPATDGGEISLTDYAGQHTLMYFHEGGGCQPCWDQIADIEDAWPQFEDAGIDAFLPVTTDPIDIHTRKMADDGLNSVAVSDTDLTVSKTYDTNSYGMMRGNTNGHSFILVDGEGTITWRADYGGEPDYTMYLPIENILADLEADRTDR